MVEKKNRLGKRRFGKKAARWKTPIDSGEERFESWGTARDGGIDDLDDEDCEEGEREDGKVRGGIRVGGLLRRGEEKGDIAMSCQSTE